MDSTLTVLPMLSVTAAAQHRDLLSTPVAAV
jgi:hypothetical protein